jgi:Ca-activated chloride channel family protein
MVAAVLLAVCSAHGGQARLNVAMGQPVLPAEKKNVTYLKVGLTGFSWDRREGHAPLNIAICLDKSGSMSGEKIRHAKNAALAALDRLSSNDIVSVVTFDTHVRVAVPATKLTDRSSVRAAIEDINADGTTALFAGVSKAAEELRKFIDRERVNRIVLLSDGQANVGPASPSDLGALGYSLRKEGISVSTYGLGLDYNEDLMCQLARRSDGNHYFVEKAAELGEVFDKEFGNALSVVAQEVAIKIKCADGIRPVRLLGREGEIAGQRVYVNIASLYAEQEKFVVLEVEVPATDAGRSREVGTVEVSYANMATKTTDKLSSTVSVTFSGHTVECEKAENPKVMASAVSLVTNEESKRATWLRDQGRIEEAQAVLKESGKQALDKAERYNDDALRSQAKFQWRDADDVAKDGMWKDSRKRMINNQSGFDQQEGFKKK